MRFRVGFLLASLFLVQSICYSQQKSTTNEGNFTIRKEVEEVVLYVTVTDEKGRLVQDLQVENFLVLEDNKQQAVTSVHREDVPIALGILIDNSGSMSRNRTAVNQAVLNLVLASNPQDQVFIVNFNKDSFLDQDFTSSIAKLKEALEIIESRSGTALYDAIVASANHLRDNGKLDKRALLVVTDGEDRDSEQTLEHTLRSLQDGKGIMVYSIGILGEERVRRAKRALKALADGTGGVAFFPKDLAEVDSISKTVAHDIRNQYSVNYKPDHLRVEGEQRTIQVKVNVQGRGKLSVRFRTGYFSGQPKKNVVPLQRRVPQ
ncbi:MAG: VWA domain-containing protein [bacterium]|nr:VWA domain-containing protein [bacterium]